MSPKPHTLYTLYEAVQVVSFPGRAASAVSDTAEGPQSAVPSFSGFWVWGSGLRL